MNKLSYKILNYLDINECTSKLKSLPTANILEDLHVKPSTFYKTIVELESLGYIEYGAKDGHSNTYFLTIKGKEELEIGKGKS